jgi:hypothetical protein
MPKITIIVKFLVIVIWLLTRDLYANSGCVANLNRENSNFCVKEIPLNATTPDFDNAENQTVFQWKINKKEFKIEGALCEQPRDLEFIFIIDRSASMGLADKFRSKTEQNLDQVLLAGLDSYINTVEEKNPGQGKLGIVVGSDFSNCKEYLGEDIKIREIVPCLYIPARKISRNSSQLDLIMSLFNKINGKFSQGSTRSSGISAEALDLASSDKMGLGNSLGKKSLVVFTDGRFYESSIEKEIFPELRAQNYQLRSKKVKDKVLSLTMKSFYTSFAILPSESPWFGETYRESIETICKLDQSINSECRLDTNLRGKPENWEINSIDASRDLSSFYQQNMEDRNPNNVKQVQDKGDISNFVTYIFEKMEVFNFPERVTYSLNGASEQEGDVDGWRFNLGKNPLIYDGSGQLEILLTFHRGKFQSRAKLNAFIQFDERFSNDKSSEMLCPNLDASHDSLRKLKGGGIKCGTIGEKKLGLFSTPVTLIFLIIPVMVAGKFRRPEKIGFFLVKNILIVYVFISGDLAQGSNISKDGSLIFLKSSSEGVGLPEKSHIISEKIRFSLFFDYADSVLKLSPGEFSKKETDLIKRLIVLHVVSEIRLTDKLSFNVHAPYILNNKMDIENNDRDRNVLLHTRINHVGKMSDISLGIKWNFYLKDRIAIAMEPIFLVPSAQHRALVGEKQEIYGLKLLTSYGESRTDRSLKNIFNMNVGYFMRPTTRIVDARAEELRLKNYLHVIFSLEHRIDLLSGGVSYNHRQQQGSSSFLSNENPAELGLFGKYDLSRNFRISGGLSKAIGEGIGAAEQRIWSGGRFEF